MSENYCIVCGEDVGNTVFSVCDDCWDKETKEYIYLIAKNTPTSKRSESGR